MKKKVLPIIILVVLWVIFFSKIVFNGEVFYCCDNLLINLPAKVLLAEEITKGHLPLWNPYLFSGTPFLADINLNLFHPSSLFYLVLSPFDALTYSIIVSVLIGLLGMYWCLKTLRVSNGAALAGSIVFGFSGAMVVYTGNAPMVQVASLLPWVFGSWVRYIEQQSKGRFTIVAVISAIQLLAGHPQLTFYSFALCNLYGLFFLPGNWWRRIRHLVGIGLLTFLLAGVQLIPFIELAMLSTRVGQGYSAASFGSLPLTSLLRLLLPSIVGNASLGTEWWQGGSVYGYIGVLAIAFILIGLKKDALRRFFLVTASFSLLAAFGSNTPFFFFLFHLVPGVSLFRVPSHFLLLTTFASAVLVAYGVDTFIKKKISQYPYHQLSFLILIIGGMIILFSNQIGIGIVNSPLVQTYAARKISLFTVNDMQSLVSAIGVNILFIGFCLDIFFLIKPNTFHYLGRRGLILLLFIDLFLYSRMNLLLVSSQTTNAWINTIKQHTQSIQKVISPEYRLFVDPSVYPANIARVFGNQTFIPEVDWQVDSLRPNLAMMFRVPMIDGYASMIYRPYQQFFDVPAQDPTGVSVGFPNKKVDLAAAGYIVTRTSPQSTPEIHHNSSARPIMSFMVENGVPVSIPFVQKTPQEFYVTYTATTSGTLVFAQTLYPGWHAFIDDKPVAIRPADTIFQSVALTEGQHTVVFKFLSISIVVGMVLTLLGIASCIIITVPFNKLLRN